MTSDLPALWFGGKIERMTRPSQLLYQQREPAPTRPAATVLLLRDTAQGLEVLMTRRSMTASFAPGAYVFPGGGIDAADAAAHGHATRRVSQSDPRLTQAIAAIRESFEELGVLLARHDHGGYATSEDIAALDRKAPFAAQCRARGLTLAADQVFVLAHWVTDRDLPRRFDVPFWWPACPKARARWPTKPNSSSRSGCARPTPWHGIRRAIFS